MRARTLETQVLIVPHWAGKDNRPADAASRSFDPNDTHFALDDTHFLKLFNSSFPFPQDVYWQLQPTCPESNRARRTIQFRRMDTSFWVKTANGSLQRFPATATLAQMVAANQVTLKLTNQKNGVRDSTLHHESVPGLFCAVKAVARRYHASRQADPTNPAAMLCLIAPDPTCYPSMSVKSSNKRHIAPQYGWKVLK
jgi:hypothetical protein